MVASEDVEQHVWAFMRKRSAPGEQVLGFAVASQRTSRRVTLGGVLEGTAVATSAVGLGFVVGPLAAAAVTMPLGAVLGMRHVRKRFLILTDQRVIVAGRSFWGHQPSGFLECIPRDSATLRRTGERHVVVGDAREPEASCLTFRISRTLRSPGLMTAMEPSALDGGRLGARNSQLAQER
jgi:hypothetical protein